MQAPEYVYRPTDSDLSEESEQLAMQTARDEWASEKNGCAVIPCDWTPQERKRARAEIEAGNSGMQEFVARRMLSFRRAARRYLRQKKNYLVWGRDGFRGMNEMKEARHLDFLRMCLDKERAEYRWALDFAKQVEEHDANQ